MDTSSGIIPYIYPTKSQPDQERDRDRTERQRDRERERERERERNVVPFLLQARSPPDSGLPLPPNLHLAGPPPPPLPLPPFSLLWISPLTLTILLTLSILVSIKSGELTCCIFMVLEPDWCVYI